MIENIQILRAVAAINVIIFHIIIAAGDYQQSSEWLLPLAGWGQNGVDLFFVISGFVMLHTQLQSRRTPWQFLKMRLIRVVPLYWLMTLFVVALLWLLPQLFNNLSWQPVWILSSFFFVAQWVTQSYPVVFVGWTLEWELLFYVLFAIALFISNWIWLCALVTLGLAAIAFSTGQYFILEFAYGMFAAWLVRHYQLSARFGLALCLVGIAAMLLTLLPDWRWPNLERAVAWGIPATVLLIGAVFAPQWQQPLLLRLGEASYSLYLIQILTIPAFYKGMSFWQRQFDPLLLASGCLLITMFAGYLCHAWIERPMLRRLRQHFG